MKETLHPIKPSPAPGAYDAWFRAKVQEALEDTRPAMPHDAVKANFAKRREAALRKAGLKKV